MYLVQPISRNSSYINLSVYLCSWQLNMCRQKLTLLANKLISPFRCVELLPCTGPLPPAHSSPVGTTGLLFRVRWCVNTVKESKNRVSNPGGPSYLKRYLAQTMQWMGSDGVFLMVHPGKVF